MGTLSRYIIRELLKMIFPIWIALSLLLYVLEWLAQVFNVKGGPLTAAIFYAFKIPSHMAIVFPVAVLFSCLSVLGGMNRNREIVALQSVGYKPRTVLLACLAAVAIASVPYFFITNTIAPMAMHAHYEYEDTQIKKIPSRFSQVRNQRVWYRNQDVLYNVGYFDLEKNKLYDATIYTFDDQFHVAQMIQAKSADWNGQNWILKDGVVSLTDTRLEAPVTESFNTRSTRLIEEPKTLKRSEFNAETMTQSELRSTIQRYKALGINTAKWEVTFQSRYSFYLIGFVFDFFAVPAAFRFRRAGGLGRDGLFVSIVCLVYWLLYNFGVNMGQTGKLSPVTAAWAPTIVYVGVVAWIYRGRGLRQQSE